MKKIYFLSGILLLLFSVLVYNGCKDSSTDPPPSGGETVTTTLSGTVFDQDNNPLTGAEVTSAGQTVITNNSGGFSFSNIAVPKDRFVVNANKTGYFRGSFADAPKTTGTSGIKIYMVSAGVTETISATAGGTVQIDNGTEVDIDANSVVNADGSSYTGSVDVSLAYLDPTSENFSSLIPGGDLQAQRTDNSQTTLYSYGIIKVEMKKTNGENLRLKSGTSSVITVDIPPSLEGTAPATIPLWYYDDATGLWKEEGTATKQGDKYVGNVSHFSDWNCDVPQGTATVKGLVVDCNDVPVPGINVKIGQASANTGSDGRFERRVPAQTPFTVQVLNAKNFGIGSQAVSVPPLAEGTVHDVGTLEVDCPVYVTGLIRCGTTVKYGQVVISWNGGHNSMYTDGDGRFKLAADVGKDAQISIYTVDGKFKNMNVTTPSVRGENLDLGNIEVCEDVITGDNKFTVNGGVFTNKTFVFTNDVNQVFGWYDDEDSTTVIWMFQTFATDTIMFWVSFIGNSLGQAQDVSMFFSHNSNWYIALTEEGIPSPVFATVTKYSGVGGLIEGTFSGTLNYLFNVQQTVAITNGQFSVVRVVSDSQLEKHKNKMPPEIRKKMKL